ncbi:MAG: hypothetical protein ABIK36_17285, partial [Pseudomonadota bacterium]
MSHFAESDEWVAHSDDALSRLVATAYSAMVSLGADPLRPETLEVLDVCLTRLNCAAELAGPAFRERAGAARSPKDGHDRLAAELAATRNENEALRMAHGAELASVLRDNDMLRAAATRLLRSPLVALADSIR